MRTMGLFLALACVLVAAWGGAGIGEAWEKCPDGANCDDVRQTWRIALPVSIALGALAIAALRRARGA